MKPTDFTKKEIQYISKLLWWALWIWFILWFFLGSLTLNIVKIYNKTCTPSEELTQIQQQLESIDRACADTNYAVQMVLDK